MKSAFRKISVHRKSDGGLTLAVIVCSAISVLMIYSISCNKVIDGVSMNDYRTQLVSAIIGVCISIVLSFIDYRKLAKLWYIYVPVAMGLVLLTFTRHGFSSDL